MRTPAPFHLAFPVDDLTVAREFYGKVLGCREGRSSDCWIDFDFWGHQLVAHLGERISSGQSHVDGSSVPVPHFGAVLTYPAFQELVERLGRAGVAPESGPTLRHAGKVGEQWTLFLRDPSGNALEFKAFRDPAEMFGFDDA